VSAHDDGVGGASEEFCCEGCRRVYETLGDADPSDHATDEPPEEPEGKETFLFVDGMHCSTCELFLESVAERVDGVEGAQASYATDTVRVVHDEGVTAEELAEPLNGYGYDVSVEPDARTDDASEAIRLLVGGFFSFLLMPWYLFYLYPSYLGIGSGDVFAEFTGPVTRYIPLFLIGAMASVVVFYTG